MTREGFSAQQAALRTILRPDARAFFQVVQLFYSPFKTCEDVAFSRRLKVDGIFCVWGDPSRVFFKCRLKADSKD